MRLALPALACLWFLAAACGARAQSLPPVVIDPADAGLSARGPGQTGPGVAAPPPVAAPHPLPTAPPPPLARGLSRVAGRVTIAGLAPKLANVPVGKDMKICGTSKTDEALEIGAAGGIRGAVVWLAGAGAPAKPVQKEGGKPARVKLDQIGCQFVPHVIAAVVGSELDIVNSDPVLHNVHARAEEKTAFNYAMPIKGYVIPRKLDTLGTLAINCDAHPWMHARVHVLPTTAFGVTDARGDFHIDVPPGKYLLHLSHERLGQREEPVEMAAGDTLQHDISLTPR
jgi:plastocyanin